MRHMHRLLGPATLVAILVAVITIPLLAASRAAAETVTNASGRYDTLVLRDLDRKQAALVQMVAENGAFTPRELWRSAKGAFDMRKATFVAADVNGDGIADGVVLYDLGGARSRLLVFVNNGFTAVKRTAWTSKPGAFARSQAKLAAGDLNKDGRDDLLALYQRGRSGATLYRFLSTGARFQQQAVYTTSSGLPWSKARLAAADATGDGRADGVVLYATSSTRAQLLVFSGSGARYTRRTFWSGAFVAAEAQLAAGDVDSDGDGDAICLARKPDNNGRLVVFLSARKSFSGPKVWYNGTGPAGPIGLSSISLAAGDVTGDGRADAVLTRPMGSPSSRLTTCVSTGSAFDLQDWWEDDWAVETVRTSVAPSPGLVVAARAEPLTGSSLRALRRVEADGTLTFGGVTGQVARLRAGDVLLAGAGPQFPEGLCRKVVAVTEQGGQVVVETVQGELADVVRAGEIGFHLRLTEDDLPDDGIMSPGVAIVRDKAPAGTPRLPGDDDSDGITFALTAPLTDVAEAEGSLTLDPDAYLDWDFGWTGLESASYRQVLNTTTDITVSSRLPLTGTREITLYKRTMTPFTIMVGAVPVVIVPEFTVKLGVEGTFVAGVTAGMTLTTETWASIGYEDGDWGVDFGSGYEATPKPPRLFSQLTLTGYASGGLDFEVYGVAGPTATLKPYVELAADTDVTPWWTLSAGLKGEIGLEVEVFDHGVFSKKEPINIFGPYVIDQAGSGGGSGSYQAPSLSGRILDATTGQAIKSAQVEASQAGGASAQTSSAADGSYVLCGLPPGSYTVTASKDHYAGNQRTSVVLAGAETTGQNIPLTRQQFQGIEGHVFTDAGHFPIWEASVKLYDTSESDFWGPRRTALTYADGSYSFTDLEPGTYRIVAARDNYFPESAVVTLAGGQLLQHDFFLVNYATQGAFGRVVDSLSGDPIPGALVIAYDGYGTDGIYRNQAVTAADGSFAIDSLPVGAHALKVEKAGYAVLYRDFDVARSAFTDLGVIRLRQLGGTSMRSRVASCIRWTEGVPTLTGRGTYEFWFRPLALVGTEWGDQIAQVSWDYPNWQGGGPARYPAMAITARDVTQGGAYATVFAFTLTEDEPGSDASQPGSYHTVLGTTPVVAGRWYHIAAQYGPAGMQLFVNGHLDASNSYTGAPEPFAGATGGAFTLGEYYRDGQGRPHTPEGDYRGLRVTEWNEYEESFTPYDEPIWGSYTTVYDMLAGTTNGENLGFVPTP